VMAGLIAVVVLISSVTGLMRGIRILSDINIKFFFAFVAFIFIFGPTWQIISQGAAAFVIYIAEFIPRSLYLGEAAADREWAQGWTVFYFANWLAWAPVTAMFLGRIARGYTVRAFVLVNLILPALFSIIWMSVFGVFAMHTDQVTGGALKAGLDAARPEGVMFEALAYLPMSGAVIPILLILAFISYVTAADSNTEAISQICRKHGDQETVQDQPITGARLKMIWVVLLALTAWIMVAFSGIDGVRMLSNVGGLPALFVVIGLNLALIRMMFRAKAVAAADHGNPLLAKPLSESGRT